MFNVKQGGAASGQSLYAAALLGVWLWLIVGLLSFKFRPKIPYLFVGFISMYVAALAVL